MHARRQAVLRAIALVVAAAPLAHVAAAFDPDGAAWTPALAAAADHAQQGVAGAAPTLAAATRTVGAPPLLAAVGMQATATAPTLPGGAEAAPEVARDETERWVPSLAFTSTLLGQESDGSVSTDSSVTYNYFARAQGTAVATNFPAAPNPPVGSCETAVASIVEITRFLSEDKQGGLAFENPQTSNGNLKLPGQCRRYTASVFNHPATVLPVSGSGLALNSIMGLSAEVMSPGLQFIPGRPRAFLHGDVNAAFGFQRDVAKQGVPTAPRLDANIDPTTETFAESNWLGTGSKTSSQINTLFFSGGLGAAFTLDAFERRLRIKPSVEYMHESLTVSGQFLKVLRVDTGQSAGLQIGVPGGPVTSFLPSLFLPAIQIQPSRDQDFHGVGPGLELEMDAARAGPVVLSLFLTGTAYKMLGDLAVHTEGTQVIPATPPYTTTDQSVSVQFDYNIHSWSYRGGAGLRFRWLPED